MQRSRLPLVILILALGCALCLCATVTGFAVFQVIRNVTEIEMPQMRALLPPADDPDFAPAVEPETSPLPSVGRAAAGVDRIVAQGADGILYTMTPDGADRVALTERGTGLRVFRQPSWSPDARRIAWLEIEGADGSLDSAVVTRRADGGELTRADTADRPPFYLAWSPDSRRVAVLSNWDAGLALRTVDIASGGSRSALVGEGAPLYFAWSPDGEQFLAHLDGEKVSLLSAEGRETELDSSGAPFGAPDWTRDGAALVYGLRSRAAQKLVVADPSGAPLRDLAEFTGALSFSVSPDGRRVAFVDSASEAPIAAFGPLSVAGLDGDAPAEVIDAGPVLAFFWSPQGDKIAYLAPGTPPAEGPRASLERTLESNHLNVWLRWRIWDGERVYDLAQFRPSDTYLLDYLRFFDQYARSMTPWAPDGRAFVYAGDSEDEVSGVWVTDVGEGSLPRRIGDGVYAAWSPQ